MTEEDLTGKKYLKKQEKQDLYTNRKTSLPIKKYIHLFLLRAFQQRKMLLNFPGAVWEWIL